MNDVARCPACGCAARSVNRVPILGQGKPADGRPGLLFVCERDHLFVWECSQVAGADAQPHRETRRLVKASAS